MAAVSPAVSNTSQTTSSAPSALTLSGERVIPATGFPSLTSHGTSLVPMTPLAPAVKMRTAVNL